MKWFKPKPTKQSILGLGGVLVLLVLSCIGLFAKQQASLAASAAQLQEKEKQLADGHAVAERMEATEKSLRSDQDELRFLESSLPHMAYVPTLLKQVEALARETHNEVRSVRPMIEPAAPPSRRDRRSDPEAAAKAEDEKDQGKDGDKDKAAKKAPEPYDKLKIALSITGGYKDCLLFIHRLTRFPKIVAVDDVQLHPRVEKDGGSPSLDVDLNLTAFILKDLQASPAQTQVQAQSGSELQAQPAKEGAAT